jgi:hypothetical protein
MDELRKVIMKEVPENKVDMWIEMVRRTFNAHLTLIVEPASVTQLRTMLAATDACNLRGSPGSTYFAMFYQYPAAGEAATAPHRRVAPLQEAHATKCIQAALEARSGDGGNRSVQPNDMFFCNDGGRPVNGTKLCNLFKWAAEVATGEKRTPLIMKKKGIVISYNEQSVRETKRASRGFSGLKTVETMYVITKQSIELPMKTRKHYTGTNQGEAIENVMIPNLGATWCAEVQVKKTIYGPRRVRVGGPDPDAESDGGDSDEDEARTDETVEPVFWRNIPRKLIDELMFDFSVCGMLDLTMESGEKALTAIENGIIYTGVCMTDVHLEMVQGRIEKEIWAMFKKEGHPKYQPSLAKILKAKETTTTDAGKDIQQHRVSQHRASQSIFFYIHI